MQFREVGSSMNRKQRRIAAKQGKPVATAHGIAIGPSAGIAELLALARRHHQSGELAEAESLYRKIIAIDQNHVDSLHLLGVIAYQVGHYDVAANWIRKAIAVNDRIPAFHNHLGLALDALGRAQDAITHYRRAIALKPVYVEAHNNLGATLQAQNKLDEAVAHYQRALALKPDFAEAHNNLGNALKEQGRLEEAGTRLQRALTLRPVFAEAHRNLGNVLKRQGKLDAAVVRYQLALEQRPNFAEAHYDLGNALQDQKRLDEAVAAFQRALVCKPNYAEAHNNLGNTLCKQGQLDAAVNQYEQALKVNPDFAEAHNNLGIALLEQAKSDQAVAHYRRVLALKPDFAEAHNNLGNALKEQGQLDAAVAHYQRALALAPDFAEAHNNLGATYQDQGKTPEAMAQYRSALALDPAYAEAHSNLGKALMEGADLTEALKAIQHSIDIEETENNKLLFVECVRNLNFIPHGVDLRSNLIRALSEPWGRPIDLAKFSGNLLKLEGAISACIKRVTDAWPKRLSAQELFTPSEFVEICDDRLFRCLLESTLACDIELERFLTATRFTMLEAATTEIKSHEVEEQVLVFFCALARQCSINEYVFAYTDHEITQAQRLRELLVEVLASETSVPELWLVAVAAYFPLTSLPLAELLPDRSWSAPVAALIAHQVREMQEERQLQNSVPRITAIADDVSLLVKQQYEESPYPRWIKASPVGKSITVDGYLRRKFPQVALRVTKKEDTEIMIAGCGTGQHSIETAQRFSGARVLAVDLSLSSLCYAKRKTREIGLNNIEYAQADILQLGSIARDFDVIEVSGVLHHLADPMAGWRLLLSMLRPGGFMRLGLYSKMARKDLLEARRFIAERDYGPSAVDIRRCRQELLGFGGGTPLKRVTELSDFFSTSACRDLLFHVQEHQLTLPEISLFLQQNQLQFLGFDLPGRVLQSFRRRFPNDKVMTDLNLWHTFEMENPSIFVGMYQFWIQKAG
jgi:tetratricopeptide (TPR) repeat protein/2-polyprenyl-3-methyl-5-hydroxy-6-metoxy-1,4-benzoquinol methylase